MIPVAKPYFDEKEERAAAEAIRSGWVVQGPRTMEFEKMVAERLDAKYALAISNCTTALHLALIALGIGPGDEVLVPSYSFIATANSVLHAGATSVFVDIDARTYNIDPQLLEEKITPRMRAIMPVHQIGLAADIDTIHDIACKHNLVVIEDAATIIGGTYKGKPIGAHSKAVCFSFHPRKEIRLQPVKTAWSRQITRRRASSGDAALTRRGCVRLRAARGRQSDHRRISHARLQLSPHRYSRRDRHRTNEKIGLDFAAPSGNRAALQSSVRRFGFY
jgi:hypothetical protein